MACINHPQMVGFMPLAFPHFIAVGTKKNMTQSHAVNAGLHLSHYKPRLADSLTSCLLTNGFIFGEHISEPLCILHVFTMNVIYIYIDFGTNNLLNVDRLLLFDTFVDT